MFLFLRFPSGAVMIVLMKYPKEGVSSGQNIRRTAPTEKEAVIKSHYNASLPRVAFCDDARRTWCYTKVLEEASLRGSQTLRRRHLKVHTLFQHLQLTELICKRCQNIGHRARLLQHAVLERTDHIAERQGGDTRLHNTISF